MALIKFFVALVLYAFAFAGSYWYALQVKAGMLTGTQHADPSMVLPMTIGSFVGALAVTSIVAGLASWGLFAALNKSPLAA